MSPLRGLSRAGCSTGTGRVAASRKRRSPADARREEARCWGRLHAPVPDPVALSGLLARCKEIPAIERRDDNPAWALLDYATTGSVWRHALGRAGDDDRLLVAGIDLIASGVFTEFQVRQFAFACDRAKDHDPYGCVGWGQKRVSGACTGEHREKKYLKDATLGVGWCHKVRGTEGAGGERMELYQWGLWHPELERPLDEMLDVLTTLLRAMFPERCATQQRLLQGGPVGAASRGRAFGAAMVRFRSEEDRPRGLDAAGTSSHVDDNDHPDALAAVLTLHQTQNMLPARLKLDDYKTEVVLAHATVTFLPARLVRHAITGTLNGRRMAYVAYLSTYMVAGERVVPWWHHMPESAGYGVCACGCGGELRQRADAPASCPCEFCKR